MATRTQPTDNPLYGLFAAMLKNSVRLANRLDGTTGTSRPARDGRTFRYDARGTGEFGDGG